MTWSLTLAFALSLATAWLVGLRLPAPFALTTFAGLITLRAWLIGR